MKFFDKTLESIIRYGNYPIDEVEIHALAAYSCMSHNEEDELIKILHCNAFVDLLSLVKFIEKDYEVVHLEEDEEIGQRLLFQDEYSTMKAYEIESWGPYITLHYYPDDAETIEEYLEKVWFSWDSNTIKRNFPRLIDFKGLTYYVDMEFADGQLHFKVQETIDAVADLIKRGEIKP